MYVNIYLNTGEESVNQSALRCALSRERWNPGGCCTNLLCVLIYTVYIKNKTFCMGSKMSKYLWNNKNPFEIQIELLHNCSKLWKSLQNMFFFILLRVFLITTLKGTSPMSLQAIQPCTLSFFVWALLHRGPWIIKDKWRREFSQKDKHKGPLQRHETNSRDTDRTMTEHSGVGSQPGYVYPQALYMI